MPINDLIRNREVPSLVERTLPRAEREVIDRALIEEKAAPYRDLFQRFGLAEKGISYSSFYRYARRVRSIARIAHLASVQQGGVAHQMSVQQDRVDNHASAQKENIESSFTDADPSSVDFLSLSEAAAEYICKYMIGLIKAGRASARQIERLANAHARTAGVQLNKDRITADIAYKRDRIDIALKTLELRSRPPANSARPTNARAHSMRYEPPMPPNYGSSPDFRSPPDDRTWPDHPMSREFQTSHDYPTSPDYPTSHEFSMSPDHATSRESPMSPDLRASPDYRSWPDYPSSREFSTSPDFRSPPDYRMSREFSRTARSARSSSPDGPDSAAPWGRKADGTPTTREEFLTKLDQACADNYGLELKYGPNPVIKRFPGDHLPEHMRTPENIALGRQGILPPGHPCATPLDEFTRTSGPTRPDRSPAIRTPRASGGQSDAAPNRNPDNFTRDSGPRPNDSFSDQSPDRKEGVTPPYECQATATRTHRASGGQNDLQHE